MVMSKPSFFVVFVSTVIFLTVLQVMALHSRLLLQEASNDALSRNSTRMASTYNNNNNNNKTVGHSPTLSTPILVLSLPKSGTTTTNRYLNCGWSGRYSAHQFGKNDTGGTIRLGDCFYKNHQQEKPLLQGCGKYRAYTDSGSLPLCFYPGMHALDNIARYYPRATIMLGIRPAEKWAESFRNHGGEGRLVDSFVKCPSISLNNESSLVEFYNEYTYAIRAFAKRNPGMTYIEFNVEDDNAGRLLEEQTGLDSACYRKCRPGAKVKRCIKSDNRQRRQRDN